MNDLRGCGRLSRLRTLSHQRNRRPRIFYETETRIGFWGETRKTPTTTTPVFGYRFLSSKIVRMMGEQTQTKWTAPVVRKTFLEFFEAKGHTVGKWRGNFFWSNSQRRCLSMQLFLQACRKIEWTILFLSITKLGAETNIRTM
jgi:hypothetical protein